MYRALLFENNVDKVIEVAREQFAVTRQVELGLSPEEAKCCTPSQRARMTFVVQTLEAEATRGPLDNCSFPSVLSNLIFEYSSR